jgi:hypothetical protein
MSDEPRSDRKPAFHIHEPNRLLGNKIQLTLDPLMARSLCSAIESLELGADEQHLYAFSKHIRRYYGKIRSERVEEVST